ncbi:MAG: hypothetical protein WC934_13795, partial [Acidithiobacillus sp.]|uniref:hypothetical protein n=1 Tax=Acidithiobacillus sp. TaxID=1872118 RepID=UPI0035601119
MRIGYAFNGNLADEKYDMFGRKESTPNGNAFYSWCIINELQKEGHEVISLIPDKDKWIVDNFGKNAFKSFCTEERYKAYTNTQKATIWFNTENRDIEIEELNLDLVLLEWRWPIPGRNCGEKYTERDLDIQNKILDKYAGKVIAFDLDYKMTFDDSNDDRILATIELGYKHTQFEKIHHVEIPFDFEHINDFDISPKYKHDLVYIGNRYERDRQLDQYIIPLSDNHNLKFYGNWLEGERDSKKKWPTINFGHRANISEFRSIYKESLVTPLLSKDDYCVNGFMTARILEAIYFGCLPIGLSEHYSIRNYLPKELIARNYNDISNIIKLCKS